MNDTKTVEKVSWDGTLGFPGGSVERIYLQCGRTGFDPWVGKIPWRREWQPTPVIWPGESNGQRSLVGDHPWGRRESDTTEQLTTHNRWKDYSILPSPALGMLEMVVIPFGSCWF